MKKRLPRLTSLAVVLLILVCVFPAYASKTKLQVIHRAVIHEEWVQRHLEGFYAENPDIEVEFIWIPTDEYLQKLQVLFASGTIGDLVEMNPSYNYGYFAKEGLWTDLEPFIAQDGFDLSPFYPTALDAARINGTLYMIPFSIHPGVSALFYNKTLFEKAGVELPTADWTYDDWLAAAKALTLDTNGDGKIDQYGMQAPITWPSIMTVFHSFGGGWIDETGTKSALNTEASVDAIQWMADLFLKHKVAPWPSEMVASPFATGQVATMLGGYWDVAGTANLMQEGMEWEVVTAPAGPAGVITGPSSFDGYAIPAASKNKEAAWKLIKYMLGDERLYDYVASGLNPTTNREINSHPDFQGLKGHTTFIKSLDEGNYIPTPMPANFRAGELRSAVISGLEAILLGDVPVSDGVKQIDAAVQRVLDRP